MRNTLKRYWENIGNGILPFVLKAVTCAGSMPVIAIDFQARPGAG